jgi:ABC-2 type transport system ATP-binding protein
MHSRFDPRLRRLLASVSSHGLGAPEAIVVEDLHKRYRNGTEAVRGVSFNVRSGEIFGLLGPNGAGKSTTVGVLGTLVRPTSGRVMVAGFDAVSQTNEVRRRIGFAMQEVGTDGLATGGEYLILQGRLLGLSRLEAGRRAILLLDLLGLREAAGRRMADYSGGMQRRVDLASALIHMPPIVFLDEPTEGLDPHARATIWEMLETLNEVLRMTIVLTTHYMEEADRLCGRIAIVDQGRIVAEGTPQELKGASGATLEDVYLRHTGHELKEAA